MPTCSPSDVSPFPEPSRRSRWPPGSEFAPGASLGLIPADAQGLILAGALLSITLNPFIFKTIEPNEAWVRRRPRLADALERHKTPHLVVEASRARAEHLLALGLPVIYGDATQ